MKKILSFVAVLAIAAPAFSYIRGDHRYGRGNGHHRGGCYNCHSDGGAISAALSTGFWLAAISSHHHYKMAIVQGEEAALAVLEGAPVNDLFVNAKDVAETVLDVQFGDEEQAALAILEMNQTLEEKNAK